MDVSVIMPAYNTAEYISDALNSILAQNFSGEYEILVSDDASSDNTLTVLRDYVKRYPDIIKLSENERNLGLSRNCESLIKRAQGKYLAFCDSDDLWTDENKLQVQFAFMQHNEDVGMICSPDKVDAPGHTPDLNPRGNFLDFHRLITGHGDIQNSSIMCRRDLFMAMYGQSEWYISHNCFIDSYWAYWFTFHSAVWCMVQPMSWYRVRKNSDCHSTDKVKHDALTKRYSLIKAYFLLTNPVAAEESLQVLSSEYDYIRACSAYEGEIKARSTKAFRLGDALISPYKKVRALFKKSVNG